MLSEDYTKLLAFLLLIKGRLSVKWTAIDALLYGNIHKK